MAGPGPRPFIPAPKVAQVEMRYLLADQQVENVYHVLGTAEWDATTLGALATAVENWEVAHAQNRRHSSAVLVSVKVIALVAPDGAFIESSVTIRGTATGSELPNNCTIALKASTGLRGRSRRGRTYWIGLSTDMQDSSNKNQLGDAWRTALLDAMNQLTIVPFPNGGVLVVCSFQHNNAWRSAALTTPIIGYGLADVTLDSQRRRLPAHNVHR